jgi:hypothetical protein
MNQIKSFLKVALLGVMFLTANVGFSQNSDSNWEVDYLTDDFGDKNGKCRLIQTVLTEEWMKFDILITTFKGIGLVIGIRTNFQDEITDRDAYLSFKTESNKVIKAKTGYYDSDNQIVLFEMTNEIVSLFKNSAKLKIALRLSGYNSEVFEVDCMGFTKAFNEMSNCKD